MEAPSSPAKEISSDRALDGPLFIVGCGRSGTTLLRLMLNMHPDLCIPEESHVIYQIARLRSFGRWPDAGSPEFTERFLQHVESSYFIGKWKLAPGSLRKRVMELPRQDFGSMLACMYEEFRIEKGKRLWGDKTPMHVQYMWIVRHFFPTARFIHMIRDARDVAQSVAAKPWGPRHLSHAGHYWKWLVLSGMITGRMLGPEYYHEVRFEDLVSRPESTLRAIAAFSGLDYTDAFLEYYGSAAAFEYAATGNEGSRRLKQKLESERIYLWRDRMSTRQVRSINRQAGAVLRLMDYECDSLSSRQSLDFERLKMLMSPRVLQRLDRQASGYSGGKLLVQTGMHYDRLVQAACFLSGNWHAWAKAGIRWQRTVASLLG